MTEDMRLVTPLVDERQPSLTELVEAVGAAVSALDLLAAVAVLGRALQAVEREAVEQAKAGGASWAAIGERLGVTKQSAAKRFAPTGPSNVEEKKQVPRRGAGAWDVTTPGGRTLVRLVRRAQ